jgi:hypothetical protein
MTTKTKVAFALPLLLSAFMGCNSAAPKSQTVQTPTSANTPPKPQDCAAISDPAAAEDCRFRAEVQKKRQKSNASPVVKHAPSSIQQP